ncbi:MAG: cell wall anchor protein, partial [Muribaculaceae bacterium]|nr:cell wall anchor protein [Muribaculaceae bacterium]
VSVPSRWYDFIPNWWLWVFIGIAAAGVIACCVLLFRKKKGLISKPVKVTPPYDLAVMRLNDLQAKKLPQSGRDKEYYTELTEILRQYLEGRFGINAMEMSSTQIIDTLRHNKETRPGSDLMKQILEIADFVKFAKVRPLPDDNIKAFNSAVKFVEDSKPLPPVDPENPENQQSGESANVK